MPTNALPNPGFEVDTSGYNVSGCTVTRDLTQAHSGVASGRLNRTTTGSTAFIANNGATQHLPALPGQSWMISGWIKGQVGRSYGLQLTWYDASHVVIGASVVFANLIASATGEWELLPPRIAGPAPAGTAFVGGLWRMESTGQIGDIQYVDDLLLAQNTSDIVSAVGLYSGVHL